jgi:hypothetical protein
MQGYSQFPTNGNLQAQFGKGKRMRRTPPPSPKTDLPLAEILPRCLIVKE